MHEFSNPRHTLSMYCGRYIRIKSEIIERIYAKWLLAINGFSESLHRQKSDQVL